MRIALVSLHTSPLAIPGSGDAGGMNVVVREAARALATLGHEVLMVTRATGSTAPGEYVIEADRGAKLIALEAGPAELRKEALPGIVSEFATGLRALGPFDAVHAHYWLSGLAALEAFPGSAHYSPVIVTTFHTLAAQKNERLAPGDRAEPVVRVLGEQRLATETTVVAGSRSEFAAVTQHCGPLRPGSSIVHPGVDTRLFSPSHETPTDAPLRVTILGRVQPLKGQDLAVRAAIALRELAPELAARTEFVIAGEPTPGAENFATELRELAATGGVAEQLRFLPAQTREQAAELLRSSSLVLVPSHSETFGLTALEAAASGVPTVLAGHTGLLEAVPAGAGAIHMADRDPRTWARTIADLLADPARRHTMGEAARAHAETHDWRAHARSLEKIYTELANVRG